MLCSVHSAFRLRSIFLRPAWRYPNTRPGRQASKVHAAAAKARQAQAAGNKNQAISK